MSRNFSTQCILHYYFIILWPVLIIFLSFFFLNLPGKQLDLTITNSQILPLGFDLYTMSDEVTACCYDTEKPVSILGIYCTFLP